MKVVWPNAGAVAAELSDINRNVEDAVMVRLYVVPGGRWLLHLGEAPRTINDTNRDPVGVGSLPGERRRFNAHSLARDLIAQAKRSRA